MPLRSSDFDYTTNISDPDGSLKGLLVKTNRKARAEKEKKKGGTINTRQIVTRRCSWRETVREDLNALRGILGMAGVAS